MALIDVPLAAQTLAQTQNPIRQNFLTINIGFSVDHVAFNTIGQGQHNKVTFPVQAVAPVFGGLNGLWSQVWAVTTIPEVWLNHANGNQYPISASALSQSPLLPGNSLGWTYLPSGVLIKWGNVVTAGVTNVNMNAIGPAFGAVFSCSVTPSGANTVNVTVGGFTPVTLTINSNAPGAVAYWIVYGRQ